MSGNVISSKDLHSEILQATPCYAILPYMDRKRRKSQRAIKVLAAVRIARTSGRDILSGIFRFIEQHTGWQLHLVQYDEDFSPETVRSAPAKGFDGIIATIPGSDGTLAALAETPLPVVFVNVNGPILAGRRAPTTYVRNDNAAIGRMAAASFLKNGNYASFAYVPANGDELHLRRGESFAARLAESGRDCQWFRPSEGGIGDFLAALPKPAAVYASSDECAVKVLAVAQEADITIPEQMALLGTDNDEFLVRHSTPPISSIQPGHVKTGFRAAGELAKLLREGRARARPNTIYIAPQSVVERVSTKPVLPAAALVKRAKAYIEAHGCERIDVADVAGHLGVSRRLADLRFRQIEGVSIRQTIENRRLAEVKRLLDRTRLSVSEIARRCGFSGPNRLYHVFKSRFSVAPNNWRTERKPS